MMRRFLRVLAALRADRRGSVAWLMAGAIVPLIAAIGLSVDGARGWLLKSRLSQAIDAAALAGGRVISATATRDDDIRMFFAANFPPGFMNAAVEGPHISVDPGLTTITINAEATIQTTFMRAVGIKEITVRADTVVKRTDRGMELVLVMDNTGSMHETAGTSAAKINAMKDAAKILVNQLYGSREVVPTLTVGLVPFAAIVNIGTANSGWTKGHTSAVIPVTNATIINNEDSTGGGSTPTSVTVCMTTNGHPFWDGALVDISGADQSIYNRRHLVRTVTTKADDGNPTECNVPDATKKFWFVVEGRTGSGGTLVTPTGSITARLPPTDYTDAIATGGVQVGWAGCVEARATNDLEEEQAEVFPAMDSERWVRAFWPSTRNVKFFNENKRKIARYKPPLGGPSASAPTKYSTDRDGDNDWGADMNPKVTQDVWDYWAYGPNFGCPSPITPLQPNKSTVLAAIDAMAPVGRSGTMANMGLAWGWRVLSPNFKGQWAGAEPNVPRGYQEAKDALISKVIVLLTDGQNLWNDIGETAPGRADITSAGDNDSGLPLDGDYTAYGRLSEKRLGTSDINTAKTQINNRMTRLCNAMKQKDIVIYTIVLQVNDTATQNLYKNCATQPGEPYYWVAPTSDKLASIFSSIATQLANLRLAQ